MLEKLLKIEIVNNPKSILGKEKTTDNSYQF